MGPKQFLKLMPDNSIVKRSFLEKLVTDPVLQSELNLNSEERGLANDALAEIYNNEKNISEKTNLQTIELPTEIANLASNIHRSINKYLDVIKPTETEAIESTPALIASHLNARGYKKVQDKIAVLGLILSHLMSIEYNRLDKSEKILLKTIKSQLKSYQDSFEESQIEEKQSDISAENSNLYSSNTEKNSEINIEQQDEELNEEIPKSMVVIEKTIAKIKESLAKLTPEQRTHLIESKDLDKTVRTTLLNQMINLEIEDTAEQIILISEIEQILLKENAALIKQGKKLGKSAEILLNIISDIIKKHNKIQVKEAKLKEFGVNTNKKTVIKTDNLKLTQNTKDCFAVSTIFALINKAPNFDLSKHLKYYSDKIILHFPESIAKPRESMIEELDNAGYITRFDEDGTLVAIEISYDKLRKIRSSENNVHVELLDKESDAQEQQISDFVQILSHIMGRMIITDSSNILELPDDPRASMLGYENKAKAKQHNNYSQFEIETNIINLFGLEELQHSLNLETLISLKPLLTNKNIVATLAMKHNRLNSENTTGHKWAFIDYDPKTNIVKLYNPHGRIESYDIHEILLYNPRLDIMFEPDVSDQINLAPTEEKLQLNKLPSSIMLVEKDDGNEYYVDTNFGNPISGLKYVNKYLCLFNKGNLIKAKITFVEDTNEDGISTLYQKYTDCYGKKHVVLFSGIYDGIYYQAGVVQKNMNPSFYLTPETNDKGQVINYNPSEDEEIVWGSYDYTEVSAND